MSLTRVTTLALILSELFPLDVWNIIMILHSYVEQVMSMRHVQACQLSLSYFLTYFPLMVSDAISCRHCILNTL